MKLPFMDSQADVIDAHAHLLLNEEDAGNPAEDLLLQMDMAGVDMAVVLAVATDKNDLSHTQKYNDFIADAVKMTPQRLIGFGSVHPLDGKEALKELDRFPDLHLKGIKLHPLLQNFRCNIPEMDLIAKKANDLKIPILIHSHFPCNTEFEQLYNFVVNHPDTHVILAHMGGHRFLDCHVFAERRNSGADNVYFDVSSVSSLFRRSPYTNHLKWLIEKMGSDRVIFGSNYPRYQLVDALSAFDELGLSFRDSQQILGKTIAELLML
jgi:predicted TIM-barrel fold metal-dependent hydrolase